MSTRVQPARPTQSALMASPVRRDLVAALERARQERGAGLTAAELAETARLHVTTVRFHLDQLVAAGVLRRDEQRLARPGRPRKVYAVVPGMVEPSSPSEPMRLLTGLLADTVSASMAGAPTDPVEAGRAWARDHVPLDGGAPAATTDEWRTRVERVTDSLRVWGYHPEVLPDGDGWATRVELTDCPFMEVARHNSAVVCGIHAGLISEAAHRLGAPGARTSLQPFVGPSRCVAHLAPSGHDLHGPETPTPPPPTTERGDHHA